MPHGRHWRDPGRPENLHAVLETDIDLAREFVAGMVRQIVVRPIATTQAWRRAVRCPFCGLPIKGLTPQHAEGNGLSLEGMTTSYPELGVSQPVEVRIAFNMKDLLANEEAVYSLVAGAGFEPATFGL